MKTLNSLLLVFAFVNACGRLSAQVNLVPNPGFETFTVCPAWPAVGMNGSAPWFLANNSSPDFFHGCSFPDWNAPPSNRGFATLMPHSGQGMIGFAAYDTLFRYISSQYDPLTILAGDYREYIACKLKCPMVTGTTYTVSYWISGGVKSYRHWNSNNMGIFFSETKPWQPDSIGPDTICSGPHFETIPQIEESDIVSDTGWVQYTYTITATANWEYMTIGNFRSSAQTQAVRSPPALLGMADYSYYFFDDIAVMAPSVPLPVSVTSTSASCYGGSNGSALAIASGGSGNYTYAWSPGIATTAAIGNLAAGNYTVVVNDTTCRAGTATITITQAPLFTASIASYTSGPCVGASYTLEATGQGGTAPYSFVWSPGLNTSFSYSTTLAAANPAYTCTLTDANGCSTMTWHTALITAPSPQPNFSMTLTHTCGKEVKITNSSSGMVSSEWRFGDGTGELNNNGSLTHSYAQTGAQWVILITTNSFGCKDSVSKEIELLFNVSSPSFNYSVEPCSRRVVFANTSTGSDLYAWRFGDGSSSYDKNPVHTYSVSQPYQVLMVANPTTLCPDSVMQTVVLPGQFPTAAFSYSQIPNGTMINFDNTSQGTTQVWWSFGDDSSSHYWEELHTYPGDGDYVVTLRVRNAQGCMDTVRQLVRVLPNMTLYVPNAFTPNGDQLNDVFQAQGISIREFALRIFDRWGNQVFTSGDISTGWDGTARDRLLSNDVYVWQIEAKDVFGNAINRVGQVTLVR